MSSAVAVTMTEFDHLKDVVARVEFDVVDEHERDGSRHDHRPALHGDEPTTKSPRADAQPTVRGRMTAQSSPYVAS